MKLTDLATRRWIGGVVAAGLTVFAAYGYMEANLIPLWLSLASHVLGLGVASALPGVRGAQAPSGEA